ncbi:MAG: T9SS type A sorting domain-containing protein, partial [Candidatus Delongbacteria bacterium]|nr:T9SS type A sorting domain-containing protein [Candidatus Delongbacteria bacterium]
LGTPGTVLIAIDHESSIDGNMPLETSLEQNYPNPFNPTTTINFSIVEAGNVAMNVYNFSGQLVSSLVNGTMSAGFHTVNFDASNLSAGVYYYTLEADNMTMSNKMILVK